MGGLVVEIKRVDTERDRDSLIVRLADEIKPPPAA